MDDLHNLLSIRKLQIQVIVKRKTSDFPLMAIYATE